MNDENRITEQAIKRGNKKPLGRLITCYVCGKSGGTLVKVDDNKYKHEKCHG